jgi:hypothetical protein
VRVSEVNYQNSLQLFIALSPNWQRTIHLAPIMFLMQKGATIVVDYTLIIIQIAYNFELSAALERYK